MFYIYIFFVKFSINLLFTESRNGEAIERKRELLEQYGLNPDEFLSETPPEVRIGLEFYVERMYRYSYSLALVNEFDFVEQEEERAGKERKER